VGTSHFSVSKAPPGHTRSEGSADEINAGRHETATCLIDVGASGKTLKKAEKTENAALVA
jgi:hypothetical protein